MRAPSSSPASGARRVVRATGGAARRAPLASARRAAGSALAALAIAAPAAAQTFAFWDVSRFAQPGQRTLFLRTPNGGNFGLPLGAGDANGDGRADPLACAFQAAEAWLFLSPPEIGGTREAIPTPNEVVRLTGAPTLGVECAQGDVDGDGLADLLLGAPGAGAQGREGVGAVYVVFGRAEWPAQVDVGGAGQALVIAGEDAGDHFGVWVDAADVDGDGSDDILIGAPDADGPDNGRENAGSALIVFGGADLVPGARPIAGLVAEGRVFTVHGADPGDGAGSALDAGHLDGGGTAAFVVGSALNRAAQAVFGGGLRGGDGPDETRRLAGEVAIVFGPARGGEVDLRAPPAEVAIVYGADAGDFAGEEVDTGDADGDGVDDLLVGALTAEGFDDLRSAVGESYLIYGGEALRGARIDLDSPPPSVTTIFGPTAGGITGDTSRFIDIDGDGRADVFIGSPTGTFLGPDERVRTGALFFVRSPAGRLPAVIQLDQPPLDELPFGVVLAADPGDILAYSLSRIDADGDGVDDVLVNGMTAAGLNNQFPNAGEVYVIEGEALAAALRPFASGDVDGDGDSDVGDLQAATAALVGRLELSAGARGEADTNGNGELDEGDLPGLLDRVLDRNRLAPGVGAGTAPVKPSESPPYRYGSRTATPEAARSFGLAAPASGRAAQPLQAVRAVFRWDLRGERPVVIPRGASVFHGFAGDRLTVLAVAERGVLPAGRPLFELRGGSPAVVSVRGATPGGSLRRLLPSTLSKLRRAGPAAALPEAARRR